MSLFVFFLLWDNDTKSLYFFRVHRRGLAALPTLLLAFGLALGAAPATGDLRVDGVGLEFSLAANFLLAVRAVTAKVMKQLEFMLLCLC